MDRRKKERREEVASKEAQIDDKVEESLAPMYGKRTRELTLSPMEGTASRPTAKKVMSRTNGPVTLTPKKEDKKAKPGSKSTRMKM